MTEGPIKPPANSLVDAYAVELKKEVARYEALGRDIKAHYVGGTLPAEKRPIGWERSAKEDAHRAALECAAGINALLGAKKMLQEWAELVVKLEGMAKNQILPQVK